VINISPRSGRYQFAEGDKYIGSKFSGALPRWDLPNSGGHKRTEAFQRIT
jgi:hypothetical protein